MKSFQFETLKLIISSIHKSANFILLKTTLVIRLDFTDFKGFKIKKTRLNITLKTAIPKP